jgi:hypothetical protein
MKIMASFNPSRSPSVNLGFSLPNQTYHPVKDERRLSCVFRYLSLQLSRSLFPLSREAALPKYDDPATLLKR